MFDKNKILVTRGIQRNTCLGIYFYFTAKLPREKTKGGKNDTQRGLESDRGFRIIAEFVLFGIGEMRRAGPDHVQPQQAVVQSGPGKMAQHAQHLKDTDGDEYGYGRFYKISSA